MTARELVDILYATAYNTGQTMDELNVIVKTVDGRFFISDDYDIQEYSGKLALMIEVR